LNSLFLPKLFKKSKSEATQEWSIEIEGNRYRTHAGQVGGVITISNFTVCEPKNVGRANATTGEEQAMAEAQSKWTKKRESYFEDIDDIGQKQYFEPMLANTYSERLHTVKFPVYSQPKLDGIRCIVTADGMFSRKGKKTVSCPHIHRALKPYFDVNPALIFDGELYNHNYRANFNKISSLVGKKKPTAEDLAESEKLVEYWIYDIPHVGTAYDPQAYDFSTRFIGSYKKFPGPMLRFVYTELCQSQADLDDHYARYAVAEFEGQIIRQDALYKNKRCDQLLKRKESIDEEFVITDVIEGTGDWTGLAGAVECVTLKGKVFTATPKMPEPEKAKLLKDKAKVIGKKCTVRFFNWTPEEKPRFPRMIALRDYE